MTAAPKLRTERKGSLLTLTMDGGETRNTLSEEMVAALADALSRAAKDRTLQALVLRGANGSFCGGADLKGLGQGGEIDFAAAAALSRSGADLFAQLATLPLAVVAVVEGPAFAGGLGLACCTDFVLCGPGARFALSETAVGLVPAQIAPYVVARLGLPVARRLCLSAVAISAEQAQAIGLADQIYVTNDELEAGLGALLKAIRRCAPGANAATKALLMSLGSALRCDYVSHAADIFAAAVTGPEGREGIAAFLAKRKPGWADTH